VLQQLDSQQTKHEQRYTIVCATQNDTATDVDDTAWTQYVSTD